MRKLFFVTFLLILLGQGCVNNTNKKSEIKVKQAATPVQENYMKNNEAGLNTNSVEKTDDKNNKDSNMTKALPNQKNLINEFSRAILKTSLGDISVEFYGDESPITVNNFLNLAQSGFYSDTSFHRVIKDFMIQGGDPKSKNLNDVFSHGTGDPGYKFADEFNSHKLVRGSLAMANSGPNTNGSQFFIVTAGATAWLDGKHTNFGFVTAGLDVLDKIEAVEIGGRDNPLTPIIIESIELVK